MLSISSWVLCTAGLAATNRSLFCYLCTGQVTGFTVSLAAEATQLPTSASISVVSQLAGGVASLQLPADDESTVICNFLQDMHATVLALPVQI
jgi:hypothetical protein